jgi:hypothetical protein
VKVKKFKFFVPFFLKIPIFEITYISNTNTQCPPRGCTIVVHIDKLVACIRVWGTYTQHLVGAVWEANDKACLDMQPEEIFFWLHPAIAANNGKTKLAVEGANKEV